jgi:hypothetical protein
MRKLFIAAALAVLVGALVPAASAGNPHDQTEPSPSVTTLVSGPTPIKHGGPPPAANGDSIAPAGVSAAAGGCGACLVTCWTATSRSGPSDWSGSVFIYQHFTWCGNGAVLTYGAVSQSYSQSGSYRLDSTYGPWWSAGCNGCPSARASGYILWNWAAPLVSLPMSGTSHLDSTITAWGGFSF